MAYQFNQIYYNPNTIYKAPVNTDGVTYFPDQTTGSALTNAF